MAASRRKARRTAGVKSPTDPACKGCPALCCHDLVMPILKPRTRGDIDELKWKLQYDTVTAFIANHRWHLQVKARCIYLTDDYLCSIYEQRPERCRRHSPSECERTGPYFDVRISTPEELEAYLARQRHARSKARARRR